MLASVQKDRAALVFIEFQREWLADDGILKRRLIQDKAAFENAVARAGEVLAAARASNWTIAHAGLDLTHDPDYLLFGKGRGVLGLRQGIPAAGTWTGAGAAFVEPFVPRPGEFIVKGRSGASVLLNSTLDPFLRNNGINTIFIMGFATHVCVESTLRNAHDLGYNAFVVEDACAAFEQSQHEYVRRHVIHHFGEETNAAALIDHMRGS